MLPEFYGSVGWHESDVVPRKNGILSMWVRTSGHVAVRWDRAWLIVIYFIAENDEISFHKKTKFFDFVKNQIDDDNNDASPQHDLEELAK